MSRENGSTFTNRLLQYRIKPDGPAAERGLKMKKSIVSALVALSAASSMIAGGAFSTAAFAESTSEASDVVQNDDPNAVTVNFWHTRGSGDNYEVVKESVSKFNETIGKEKGINVVETFIGDYNDIFAKTQLAIQSGEAPQVVVLGNTFVNYLLEDDVLVDMAPLAEETGFDKNNLLDPFLQINGNTGDTLYTLPYVRSTPMFYYNKTMADAAGLSAPVTVDDMVEFCKALDKKDDQGNTDVYGLCLTNDFGYLHSNWLYELGSEFIAEDGNSAPCLDDGTMLKVLGDWRGWVDEGWCEPFAATDAGNTLLGEFAQQRIASMVASSGALSSVLTSAKDAGFELGVCEYPTYDVDNSTAEIGGGNICLISEGNSDEQIKAAWEFAQFLMSDEMVTLNTQKTGYVPVTKSVADYDGMKTFWQDNPFYKVAYDQVSTGRCQENPYSEHLQDFSQVCWDAVSSLIADQSIDAEEAVQQMKDNSAEFFS